MEKVVCFECGIPFAGPNNLAKDILKEDRHGMFDIWFTRDGLTYCSKDCYKKDKYGC